MYVVKLRRVGSSSLFFDACVLLVHLQQDAETYVIHFVIQRAVEQVATGKQPTSPSHISLPETIERLWNPKYLTRPCEPRVMDQVHTIGDKSYEGHGVLYGFAREQLQVLGTNLEATYGYQLPLQC